MRAPIRKALEVARLKATLAPTPHAFRPSRRATDEAVSWQKRISDSSISMPEWALSLYQEARKSAAKRDIRFDLSLEHFNALVIASEQRCMVSGIPFNAEPIAGSYRRPWTPSLDRIDSSLGYLAGNCRIVCCAVNIAMNDWGIEVLMKIAHALVENQANHKTTPLPESKRIRGRFGPVGGVKSGEFKVSAGTSSEVVNGTVTI